MRQLTVKYDGECKKCGQSLEVGQQAMYEKSMGLFCIGCEPTEVEDIRAFRLAKAEGKADRYEGWAQKREQKASAQLNSYPEIRHDHAFITQPGHIPFRARMNKADDRAHESLQKAKEMRGKAASLRSVRVAGDAERKREKIRQALDNIIKKGSKVYDFCFGEGVVLGVYKKSYRIRFNSKAGEGKFYTCSRDKSYIRPVTLSEEN